MTKLQYQCAMSLDGFIAGRNGDMSWMGLAGGSDDGGDSADDSTNPLVAEVGAVLSGSNTYHGDDPNAGTDKEGGYDGQYEGHTFVLTHHIPEKSEPGVTFVDDLEKAIALAKEAAGDKLVSVLGADVARQCIAIGALDEILVYVTPILLGDGVRLFHNPGGEPVRLEIVKADELSILSRVVY
ncbi:deaminase [Actinoplanes italicus]|uniref:Dihydrofolate reductase n=1 Tax=Actinoplanes italicus TaxID=113567 RepID=A0A2T0K8K0_9ACTN|nr:dihydrofolate reductase family protein [Actinoplanes italicus]PRX19405.1 dihydrofolate reductase [Actinoplanes italicus]GIE30580.1 deaminase [Actinoplanes italicus]